jgi:diguanylate cyclase (GGDEF)-like protein
VWSPRSEFGRRVRRFLAPPRTGRRFFWAAVGTLGVSIVFAGDVLTGREMAFGLFYLIPVAVVTWFSGAKLGLGLSVVSAMAWFLADELAGVVYTRPLVRVWNAAVRLGFFLTVTFLLPALKALEHERALARVDDLTGAANRRHFSELLQAECDRSRRYGHPFVVAYIDLDNFKAVNDRWGHDVGDEVLCAVVERARRHLRRTDVLARLGGDEFVVLLPETGPEAARVAIPKIHSALLDEMGRRNWPVSFSIGVVTCVDGSVSADALMRRVDEAMYAVKLKGKNAIEYAPDVA